MPCRIVFRIARQERAMYSTPPCPSLAASAAAYRRRILLGRPLLQNALHFRFDVAG